MNLLTTLPPGFMMRPATLEDLETAVSLLNACAVAQTGAPETTANELQSFWQSPGFDIAQNIQVVISPEGQLVGYVDVEEPAVLPVNPMVFGRVHPEFEGYGIGTALMTWGEQRARENIAKVPDDVRVVMRCFGLSTHQPTKQLLADHELKLIRHSWHMVIDLTETPPTPQWPDGIVLRTRQEVADMRAIFRATDEAFKDHWGHVDRPEEEGVKRFQHWVDTDEEHDPNTWFLAMDGDEIAAVALCRPISYDDPGMAWVNTLGVRRPWRRQGLGLALLHHAFGEFYRRGKKRVGLGVDASSLTGATRLYEKAGMRVSRQYDTYEKELRPGRDLSTQTVE